MFQESAAARHTWKSLNTPPTICVCDIGGVQYFSDWAILRVLLPLLRRARVSKRHGWPCCMSRILRQSCLKGILHRHHILSVSCSNSVNRNTYIKFPTQTELQLNNKLHPSHVLTTLEIAVKLWNLVPRTKLRACRRANPPLHTSRSCQADILQRLLPSLETHSLARVEKGLKSWEKLSGSDEIMPCAMLWHAFPSWVVGKHSRQRGRLVGTAVEIIRRCAGGMAGPCSMCQRSKFCISLSFDRNLEHKGNDTFGLYLEMIWCWRNWTGCVWDMFCYSHTSTAWQLPSLRIVFLGFSK